MNAGSTMTDEHLPPSEDDEFLDEAYFSPKTSTIPAPETTTDSSAPPTSDDETEIGVWGAPGSGKTILLGASVYTLRSRLGVYSDKGYEVMPSPRASLTEFRAANFFLNEIAGRLRDGYVPPPNVGIDPFWLSLGYKDGGNGEDGRYHELRVVDASGEYIVNDDPEFSYWHHLRKARGIFFVVDGEPRNSKVGRSTYAKRFRFNRAGVEAGYGQLISNFYNIIGREKRKPFLAICITKADTIPAIINPHEAEKQYRSEANRERLLKEIIGNEFGMLTTLFRGRYRIFVTSATGWYQEPNGDWRSNVSNDGETLLDENDLPTYQAALPLAWLFDKIEEERIQEHRSFLWRNFVKRRRISNIHILQEAFLRESGYLP